MNTAIVSKVDQYRPNFLVLRTPTFPFSKLRNFLSATNSITFDPGAKPARYFEPLRPHFLELINEPEFRKALFFASRSLYASVMEWASKSKDSDFSEILFPVFRYFSRMATRSTPFGLFSGVSFIEMGEITRLQLAPSTAHHVHGRIDSEYVSGRLKQCLLEPEYRKEIKFCANDSLYSSFEKTWRFYRREGIGKKFLYVQSEAEGSDELSAVIDFCKTPRKYSEITRILTKKKMSPKDSEEYIEALIQAEILMPSVYMPAVSDYPVDQWFVDYLQQFGQNQVGSELQEVVDKIKSSPLSEPNLISKYESAVVGLKKLSQAEEPRSYFQVDLHKSVKEGVFSKKLAEQVLKGFEVARTISTSADQVIGEFIESFAARYEGQEVPLLEALDSENGIGLRKNVTAALLLENAPPFSVSESISIPQGRHAFLLEKITRCLELGENEIILSDEDIQKLKAKSFSSTRSYGPKPFPDTFEALFSLIPGSEDLDHLPQTKIIIRQLDGPGVRFSGRFCFGNDKLLNHAKQVVQTEEAALPANTVIAEIVHFPGERALNVSSRPKLHRYETSYAGSSATDQVVQIPVRDILVSLDHRVVRLRSKTLNKFILPRLSCHHNFYEHMPEIYEFLCRLQEQNRFVGAAWDWGTLAESSFLPRVSHKNFIFSPAKWRFNQSEIEKLQKKHPAESIKEARLHAQKRKLPRYFRIQKSDNFIFVDLENNLSVETWLDEMKGQKNATMIELYSHPDNLCITDGKEGYMHEMTLCFSKEFPEASTPLTNFSKKSSASDFSLPLKYGVGSEWLFFKLYSGDRAVPGILNALLPTLNKLAQKKLIDRWFFIQYVDPDFHLRLRVHGDPKVLIQKVFPVLQTQITKLVEERRVYRTVLDTYTPEVARYGGVRALVECEKIFYADSVAVAELFDLMRELNVSTDEAWKYAMKFVEELLINLGFDITQRHRLFGKLRDAYGAEFEIDGDFRKWMGEKFRVEREGLIAVLEMSVQGEFNTRFAKILKKRAAQMKAPARKLRQLEVEGKLNRPLESIAAGSLVHMCADRVLGRNLRPQELVIYNFLFRMYDAKLNQK